MSRDSPANRADLSHENLYFSTTHNVLFSLKENMQELIASLIASCFCFVMQAFNNFNSCLVVHRTSLFLISLFQNVL